MEFLFAATAKHSFLRTNSIKTIKFYRQLTALRIL